MMQRRLIIKRLEENGFHFDRSGANHDLYVNPVTKRKIAVPRHRDVPENTAKVIFKEAGLL